MQRESNGKVQINKRKPIKKVQEKPKNKKEETKENKGKNE